MDPRPAPEVVVGHADTAQATLPLASEGVQRWLWQSRFGAMLIEVVAGEVYVNGQKVQPHVP